MSDSQNGMSRRGLLTTAGALSLAGAAAPLMAADPASAALPPPAPVTGEAAVSALEGAYGVHRGQRRNHTKGVGALGSFTGNPEMAAYSRSALFGGKTLEVVARFSLAGGDPAAADTEKSPRGMALEIRLPDGAPHHLTMLHTPTFFAAVPRVFLDQFIAMKIDAATGKADPAKLKAFMAKHETSPGQGEFLARNNPPPSFANCAFYGIHTFKFIDRAGKVTLVKYRFVPRDGEKQLTDVEQKTWPRDFLEKALIERMKRGPALWDMIVTIGEPGDVEDNPTLLWPANRREIKAGTLSLASAAPSADAGSYKINFDPLVMADGIAATDDPVLLFRSPSYGASYSKRLQGV